MPKTTKRPETGYCDCACRDCFEIAIGEAGKAFCHGCEEAGCEHDAECQQEPDLEGEEPEAEPIKLTLDHANENWLNQVRADRRLK